MLIAFQQAIESLLTVAYFSSLLLEAKIDVDSCKTQRSSILKHLLQQHDTPHWYFQRLQVAQNTPIISTEEFWELFRTTLGRSFTTKNLKVYRKSVAISSVSTHSSRNLDAKKGTPLSQKNPIEPLIRIVTQNPFVKRIITSWWFQPI